VVIFFLITSCQQQQQSSSDDHGPIVIAAIGDSLTWGALAFGPKADSGGYPILLETMLRNEGYDIVVFNKGIPGEKAYQTRERFPQAISDADIALLMIGVNDIIRPEGCPEPNNCQTADHIAAMMRMASKSEIPVLVSTLTPAQTHCARSWANEPIQAVNDQIRTFAQQQNTPLVDMHQAIIKHGGALFSDCLHFTDEGYQVIADHWYRAIIEHRLLDTSTP
jgi:lysophospholipase L1-like esterase